MKSSKKIMLTLLLSTSALTLNSCIIAALAVGGGTIAYLDGKYSMNMEGNYKDAYKAALKAVNDNNGDKLYQIFNLTKEVRKEIIKAGQDTSKPDFGRKKD